MPSRRRALLCLLLFALLAAASLTISLAAGSLDVSSWSALSSLWSGDSLTREVVLELRLPRALAGFACGGLLAVAGALMQILLRNPLADPYVLGVSGGAGVGALAAMFFGLPLLAINGLAFAGACGAMLLVFGLAHGESAWTQPRLLLTGVVVAAGCGAVIALLLSIAPQEGLRGMLFWLMGDLGHVVDPLPTLIALVIALALTLPFARDLNLLARGEHTAHALGVSVQRLRWLIYGIASLATAVAVSAAGSIGFVGLIVPHLVRMALGNDQRLLLPAAALAGGTLLVLADTAARTLFAPQQLPVGVLTALLGVPLFLYLLSRQPR